MSDDRGAAGKPAGVVPKSAYHHGDLRAQLLAAVRDLVETHGPDGFSVSEAARRAGVSTAAPYKHFKDRHEILRGVVAEALDRLRLDMEAAAARFPEGSHEAVAAVGEAYVAFARAQPGTFRLAFGLTEGHEDAPDLLAKGRDCFAVVVRAAAACMRRPEDAPEVSRRAYRLWAFVHGHAFLTIDGKNLIAHAADENWRHLMAISRGVLGGDDAEAGPG